jgi:hypothetical protein
MKKWANALNREFSKEEVQMAKKYMKKCSTSPVINEMQMHLIPVRMVIIKSKTTTNVGEDVAKWESLNTGGGNVN